jgi:metallo-beta-lactamase class B
MQRTTRLSLAVTGALAATTAWGQVAPDQAKSCASCEQWNRPQQPFRIFGNTYYVGTTELAAILIQSTEGLILLDGALPQSALLIDESIRALGFSIRDLRLILTSHAHYDHVGGIAALQRASDATVTASPSSASALRQGRPTADDPQYATADNGFPPVDRVSIIQDGESLALGDVRITAHFTPGHTPGSTSWSWQSCDANRCVDVVYADSLNPVSADEFRFTGDSRTPSIVDTFRRSIRIVQELPCDILLTAHPGFVGMSAKSKRLRAGDPEAFIDSSACRVYGSAADQSLTQRIEREATGYVPRN